MRRAFDRFTRDKNNNTVIGQFPNLPIIGWFVFMIAAHAVSSGFWKRGFTDLSAAFLFTWSYLEITQGVSSFRRTIGTIVAIGILISYFY